MQKCLVCGQIFGDEINICPVCGVGKENFVPIEAENRDFKEDTDEIFLILGTGVAAVSAAEAIRKRNATCNIVLLGNESTLPYNRPMLTKKLTNLTQNNNFFIRKEEWYQQNQIYLIADKTISGLDPSKKQVHLIDGSTLQYDKCIYALGASNFIPPIPGSDLKNVCSIRSIEDVTAINHVLPDVKSAVVIGGGVLGLEAAWELCNQGIKIHVLEAADRLMPRQLDEDASQMLKDKAAQAGIEIILNAQTQSICGDTCVNGVILQSGQLLEAQLVIMSCGVRANTAIAKAAGIETDRGVLVNEYMKTATPGVYACGDCAQHQNANFGLWAEALNQGKVAGANAAGDHIAYEAPSFPLSFVGFQTRIYCLGEQTSDSECVTKDQDRLHKNFYKDGKLCGFILIGDTSQAKSLTKQIES